MTAGPSPRSTARSPRALSGRDALDQRGVDALDARPRRHAEPLAPRRQRHPGGVDRDASRAGAAALGEPLFRRLRDLAGETAPTMPMPMVNILSGGLHAARRHGRAGLPGHPGRRDVLRPGARLDAARPRRGGVLCDEAGLTTLLADEGGLSPGFADGADALDADGSRLRARGPASRRGRGHRPRHRRQFARPTTAGGMSFAAPEVSSTRRR